MTVPNFIICGAQRSGTTSLYHYLAQHPDIFMAPRKETHYFSKNCAHGPAWYEQHFAGSESFKVIGEASPTYMDGQDVPARMAKLIPDAKLCFLLRNPVERAYSAYWFGLSFGQDPEQSFSDAIRTQAGYAWYVKRGFYHTHIQRFLEHFDQMHFILTEELKDSPLTQVAECFRFLGVDTDFIPDTSQRFNPSQVASTKSTLFLRRKWRQTKRFLLNTRWFSPALRRKVARLSTTVSGRYSNQKPPMLPQDRAYLTEIYQEHNTALAEFLGRDLPW